MSSLKSHYQTTIDRTISFVGIGVHSGEVAILKLKPTTQTRGIVFRRMDVSPDKGEILGRQYNVSNTTLSTTLTNDYGTSVSTVEHLLTASIYWLQYIVVQRDLRIRYRSSNASFVGLPLTLKPAYGLSHALPYESDSPQ